MMTGYRFGSFSVDLDRDEVLAGDRPVALPRKNFEVLRELVRAEGRLVQRDDLVRSVWPDTVVEEATIRQNIYTLRTMLREVDGGREYVETVPKAGYRLAVPVERLDAGPLAQPPAVRRTLRFWLAAVLAAVLLIAAAAWSGFRGSPGSEPGILVSQAWEILDQRNSELFPSVETLLDEAIRIRPKLVAAHEARAVLFALESREKEASAEASTVESLDRMSGTPAAVRGFDRMMYHWDWAGAGREFAGLDKTGCGEPVCHQWRALYLGLTGDVNEAVREANFAIEVNAGRLAPHAQLAQLLYWAGENDYAISEARTVIAAGGVWTHARYHLWKALWLKGDRTGAAEAVLLSRNNAWFRLGRGDGLHELMADPAAWNTPDFWNRLFALQQNRNQPPSFLAELAMAKGDRESALRELENALHQHDFFLPFARRDPLFATLRGDPRYQAVMKAVGL